MDPITAGEFGATLSPPVATDTVRTALRRDPNSPRPTRTDRASGARYYDPTALAAWWPKRRQRGKPKGATMQTLALLEQARTILAPWTEEEVMVWQKSGLVMVKELDGISAEYASALANRLLDAGMLLMHGGASKDAWARLADGKTCQVIRRDFTAK